MLGIALAPTLITWLAYLVSSLASESLNVTANLWQDKAVIDSWIEFKATFHSDPKENITFKWRADACDMCELALKLSSCRNRTWGQKVSHLTRVFTTYDVVQEFEEVQYHMYVEAYRKNSILSIASGQTTFNLTKGLNGNITILQNGSSTPYQQAGIFSTANKLLAKINIFDSLKSPTYSVTWKLNGEPLITKNTTSINTTFPVNESGHYTLQAVINAELTVFDQENIPQLAHINGTFATSFVVKDPISNVAYFGNRSYSVGDNISGIINCSGSGPFKLSVLVIDPIGGVWGIINQCKDCFSQIFLEASRPGTYQIKCSMANDVSLTDRSIYISVAKGPNIGATIAITIFGALVGICAPILICYTHLLDRRRNRQSVEHADFNFLSSYSDSDVPTTATTLARLVRWLKGGGDSKCDLILKSNGVQPNSSVSSYGAI